VRRGQPLPPGETGRLAITDLVNTAMPLIRYDVGDVGRLQQPGLSLRAAHGTPWTVLGRSQEVLDTLAVP